MAWKWVETYCNVLYRYNSNIKILKPTDYMMHEQV
jgi:hypothetical protein